MRHAKGAPLRRRTALMLSTALQAVAVAVAANPAAAQLAANTRPGGGQVTAGQASISGNATTTLINQTSEKAAINWQSYNVGSAQTVRYQQPNASAVTLNNVISANPSLIAGKILANGQIIIVNQSGVVFAKGSQVDTAGLVVSSAGISQQDFMAGRMVFSQAGHPGAMISNAGNITVRQAGLAALVAPQVANSGTITANLGRVILAGATTHTLDLYGDGLVALNVTGQVTQVELDGKLVPALVTNTGTILAPGGTVVLTAAAADGVVTNLVSAGGTIAAPSAGAQTGRVLVQGIGGGVTIDGQVSATGTKGGQIEVNATGNVTLTPNALIDASGSTGGGVISVGTTAARAMGGPSVHPTLTAQSVSIASGARIRANATRAGQGGRIAVLSKTVTKQAGTVTATGGPISGNGGWLEISGNTLALGGATEATAAHGRAGTILLDPLNLILGTGTTTSSTLDVTQAELNQLNGNNVILQASGTLTVSSKITFGSGVSFLQLEGDDAVLINAPVVAPGAAVGLKSLSGSITENASGSITATSISANAATSIDLAGQNTSTTIAAFSNTSTSLTLTGIVPVIDSDVGGLVAGFPSARLEIGSGQMPGLTAATTINVDVSPTPGSNTPNTLTIDGVIMAGTLSAGGTYTGSTALNVANGNIAEDPTASILTGTLSSAGARVGGSASFGSSTGNTIATLTNFKTTGAFTLDDATALTIGSLNTTQGAITISAPGLTLAGTLTAGTLASASSNGGTPYTGLVTLDIQDGDIAENSGASLRAGTLSGATRSATFTTSAGNTISTLTGFTADDNFALEDNSGLTVGALLAKTGSLEIAGPGSGSPTGSLILAGDIFAGTTITASNALGISIPGTLTTSGISNGGFAYAGQVTLDATNGNITETTGGAIRTGTLSSGGTAVGGSANFAIAPGNTITTLTDFKTGGDFALDDESALTIGTLAAAGAALSITAPGITLAGTLTAGTLASAASNGGTPYTGLATLDATGGSIIENTGASLRAGTLSGQALATSPSGSATFFNTSVSNTISTLTNFTTGGNFALEDDSGLTVGLLTSKSGSLAIFGPATGSPTGSLILAGDITAATSISFSNALAIVELSGASLTGSSSTGTAVALSAGAGITLAGTITAGTLATTPSNGGTPYTGLASLYATDGNIIESGGVIRAGTLTGGANSTAASLTAASGNATLTDTQGNTISTLTGFTTAGDFALEDSSGLTVGFLSAKFGSLDVFGSGTGTLALAGTITAGTSISFSNALGISIGGTLSAGAVNADSGTTYFGLVDLDAGSGNIAENPGASIRAGTLSGDAGSTAGSLVTGSGNASFSSAGNTISTLTGFTAAGNFALADDTGLTVGAVSAKFGSLAITGASTGTLTLAGDITAGTSINFSNNLAISQLSTSSLTGSSSTGTAIALAASSGMTLAGTLTAGTLATAASNGGTPYTGLVFLDVTDGNIIESGGILRAGTLSGAAGSSAAGLSTSSGNATFTNTPGNTIGTLTNFIAAGNVALEDNAGLTVGALSSTFGSLAIAGPGTGSPTGSLILAGDITAATSENFSNARGISIPGTLSAGAIATNIGTTYSGVVTLDASSGTIAETGGAIFTGTLTSGGITVGGNATFTNTAGNTISTLTNFQTSGNFALDDDSALTIGTLAAAGGAIAISAPGITLAGTLTAGTLAGAASNGGTPYTGLVTLDATGGNIAENAGASIRAGTLSGQALSGTATFANTSVANTISTLTHFTAEGNFTLEDNSGLTVGALSSTSGSLNIAGPGIGSPTGSLILAGDITAGTSITFSNTLAIAEVAGADVTSASNLALASSGSITQAGSSSLTGPAIALNAGTGITLSGSTTAGTLSAGGTTYSGSAALNSATGTIAETSSAALRAGTLTAAAADILLGAESSATSGNQITDLAASSAAGRFQLTDGQALTITGAATASSIAIVAPAIDEITGGSLVIAPANGNARGILSLVADQFGFVPGGVQNAGGMVALDLLNSTTFAINTQAGATISPASLQNIEAGSGTIAIGSLDGAAPSPANASSTGWTIGTGGTVSLIDITSAFDLKTTGAAATLGLFSNGSITSSAGFTVTTLYGQSDNGTTSLTGGNAISTLSTFTTAETPSSPSNATAFLLDDTAPLTVLGPVTAAQGAVNISVSRSNGLTLGSLSGGGNITGTDIDLSAAGTIAQLSGTLAATGASNAIAADSTPGSIVLISNGSGLGLGSTARAALSAPASHGVILLYAGAGDIIETPSETLTAGTLAAQASGNIQLKSPSNAISVIAPLTATLNSTPTTLSGLVASGTTGIAFTDASPLTLADGALISAFGPLGTTGPGTGTIALTAAGLTLGTSAGATLAAPGDVTLNATGAIVQTGGLVLSDANVALAAGSGITFGGTVTAGTLSAGGTYTGIASFNAASGNIVENGGALRAGTLTSGGTAVGGSANFGLISAGNTISTLTDFKTTGDFALEDDTALSIGSLASTGGAIAITGPASAVSAPGSLTVNGPVSALTSIGLTNALGITLSGTLTAGTIATFDVADGNIAENNTGSIRAGTLTGQALSTAPSLTAASGNATLTTSAGNTISTLTGFTADGNVTLEDNSGLTVGALSAKFGGLTIFGPTTGNPSGNLILAGDITAGTSISFSNSLAISELAGASLTGSASTGTAIALSAGTGITLAGTTTAGTLSGGAYTGLATLNVANGNIDEHSGILRAGTLSSGGATIGGAANVAPGAGNAIATLTNFATTGNFTLEDDSALTIGALTSKSGSINITGPASGNPTGTLSLAGNIAAATSITFSNTLGISEFLGAGVTSAGVTLSTGGAFIQAAGSSLTGTSSTGTAIALAASGGVTLAGTTTAGTLTAAGTATGLATLNAAGGSIDEHSGILRAGTLTSGGTIIGGTANFAPGAGNTIATLTNLAATGNFTLEDDSALTIGALTSKSGSIDVTGPASGNPSGTLSLAGAITAGTSITFSNNLGISEQTGAGVTGTSGLTLSTGGAIIQATGSTLTGSSSTGTAVALNASTGITLAGTTTAGTLAAGGTYTGLATLTTSGGNIDEHSGIFRAATLTSGGTTIGGAANFAPSAGNTIATLTNFIVNGNFALEDDAALTIGALASKSGSINIIGPASGNPTGTLSLAGNITAATSITFSNTLGISEVSGASATGAGLTLSTGGAITQAAGSSLTGSGSAGTALALNAGTGISFDGTLTAGTLATTTSNGGTPYTGLAVLEVSTGNIVESGGILRAGTLSGAAGTAAFTNTPGNTIGTLTNFTTTGDFALEDTSGLTIGALAAKFGSLLITGPTGANPTGILILAGDITAGTSITFTNALGIAEQSGASVTGTSGLTLSTGGSISQAAGSSLTGSSSTGTAIALSASRGITLSGTTTAGTLAAGGTYTGLATFNSASGNIDEHSGSLRAATLTSSGATIGGNANFAPTSGNTISTLTKFAANGNFSLEDDAALTINGVNAGGSIDIFGPSTPAGILVISGAISAGSNISLSNALGIAELASGSVISTGGSAALNSGGAIAQQAGASLSGANGLSLGAAGSTNFKTYLPNEVFGTIDGISFGGVLAAPGGTLALTANQGNITETGPGQTTSTGTLQANLLSAIAHTGTLAGAGLITLDTPSSATTGNQIAGLSTSAADGAFALSDGTGLTVTGAVQAGLTATTPTTLQIIAPAIDVTTGSLAIVPPAGIKPGILSLVANQFTFANAGAISTPGGIVSLDLLDPATSGPTVFGIGPAATVSAASLADIRTNSGTLLIGSLNGTQPSPGTTNLGGWTTGQGGTVDQILVAAGQTVDLTNSAAVLGLFTNATTSSANGVADLGGISVGSLYGIANGIFSEGPNTSNAIGTLLSFSTVQAPGKATAVDLTDTISLKILGPVTATTGGIDIAVTSGGANSLTIAGNITGSDVFLSATGDILQSTGTIDAKGATATQPSNSTNGTAGLSAGGAITLHGVVQAGTSNGALLLSATTGDITEQGATLTAGTLAALSGGDIMLNTGANRFGVIAPLAAGTLNLSLKGLTAEGTAGIDFTDSVPLTVADGALISAFGPAGTTGPGTGSITISLATGTLALGTTTGATLAAPGNITLTAPGTIDQTGGTIAAGGSVFETATGPTTGAADINQTAGSTLIAGQDVTLVSATGSFTQTDSSITGSNAVTIDVLHAISQSATSTIAAPGASGTIILGSEAGSVALNGLIAAGGSLSSSGTFTPAGASDVLLFAGAGDIAQAVGASIDAGTLAAQAKTGNISLPGNNQVSTIGSLGTTLAGPLPQTLTLYGLSASGASGIAFTDTSFLGSLRIGPDTGAHPVIDASGTEAPLTITMNGLASISGNTIYGSLVLGGSGASSLRAGGAITLDALGSILQDAGTINSANGSVTLASTEGAFLQTRSTIKAATDVTITTGLDVDQTGGTITASDSLSILAGGSVNQSSGATFAAGSVASLTSPTGSFAQSGSSILAPSGVTLSFYGDVVSTGGTFLSTGTTNPATPGTVSITSTNGSISATQGALIEADSKGSEILLSAQGDIDAGDVNTGTLAATAGGNIVLLGKIADIAATGTFTGLTALTGNIDLSDQQALTVESGAAIEALIPSGTITIGATALTLSGATIEAGSAISLTATGALSQTGGLIDSDQGGIGLTGNAFSETGGASIVAAQNIAIDSATTLLIQNSVVQAGAPTNGIYGGALSLSAGSLGIEAATGTLLTGTLAATSTGPITLSDAANEIAVIGTAGTLTGLTATGNIALQDAQSLEAAAPVSATGSISFIVSPGAFTDDAGIAISTNASLSINAAQAVSIGGSLASFTLNIQAGGAFTENAAAAMTAKGTSTIASGQSVEIDGRLNASGASHIAAATDIIEGSTGLISIPAPATLTAPGSITLDGVVKIPGTLSIIAGTNFLEGAGASIGSGNTAILASSGTATLGGALAATGTLGITAGADIDETQAASIIAGVTSLTAKTGSITIDGLLETAQSFTATAGTNFIEGTVGNEGTITLNPNALPGQAPAGSAVSIAANGLIAIDGDISYPGAENFTTGIFSEAGGATISSLATGNAITINVPRGPANIAGRMSATGSIAITSLDGIGISGTVQDGGTSLVTTGGMVSITGSLASGATLINGGLGIDIPGAITAGATNLNSGGGSLAIEGSLYAGATTMIAGTTLDLSGTVNTAATSVNAGGEVTIGGTFTSGMTTIFASAIDLSGVMNAAGTQLDAHGPVTIGGVLNAGATSIFGGGPIEIGGTVTAGGLSISSGSSIDIAGRLSANDTYLSSGAATSIEGSLAVHGALSLVAANSVTLSQGATISAASAGITASRGTGSFDGSLTTTGALSLMAGTDLSQGSSATISAGTTASLLAPGAITLAGLLSAPKIGLGDPSSAIVWDNNTILSSSSLGGPTNAISVPAPLTRGQGIFVDAASLQQIGTSFVDPLTGATAATLQINVSGKGTAHFANLDAPKTQLVLALQHGGFANGLIDVSGLNVFFTQGQTPSQAADLFGTVGGRGGTAAAAAGFAHLFSNINYQVNGCPIQSINCILLSPIVVPVVNPVNDFAEGTQRKRHSDDDALPNVGEEDY